MKHCKQPAPTSRVRPPSSVFAPAALIALASPTAAQGSAAFAESFDGQGLSSLEPLESLRWDYVVHSRALERWFTLESMAAAHGLDAAPPPATHTIETYEDAVYIAKQHVMTAINSESYGLIYLTPDALADWSAGECVIRFDVSTLRTSRRDWIDLWLTPWDDHMILPLEEELPDLHGNPRRGLQFRMSTWNTFFEGQQVDWSHFETYRFDDYEELAYPVNVLGYENFVTPSPKERQTFELRISRTHLKFGLPEFDLWWIDREIEDLGFDRAVIQFGHHSYNPLKDGVPAPIGHDPALAGTANPSANTWHWDNFEVAPTTRFDIIPADRRAVIGSAPETVVFERAAPAGSYLRFAAVGAVRVSFDGGAFHPATRQDGSAQVAGVDEVGFFSSYWMEVPAGTQTVDFELTPTGIWAEYKNETMAKDMALWSLAIGGTGCAGSGGLVPTASTGDAVLGNASFAIGLTDALPTAAALLITSLGEIETELCGVAVALDAASLPTVYAHATTPAGTAEQALGLPADPSLAGLAFYAQWAVVDPVGAFDGVPGLPLALSALRRIVLE